jgi:hypothetical protein
VTPYAFIYWINLRRTHVRQLCLVLVPLIILVSPLLHLAMYLTLRVLNTFYLATVYLQTDFDYLAVSLMVIVGQTSRL